MSDLQKWVVYERSMMRLRLSILSINPVRPLVVDPVPFVGASLVGKRRLSLK